MNNKLKDFFEKEQINCLLVNCTNEFLVEYADLRENSRYTLTGFSGSTGDALVTTDRIYLFVDGRYHAQADSEVNHEKVEVVKLKLGQKAIDEITKRVPDNAILGIVAKKNSQAKYESLLKKINNIKLLDTDPINNTILPRVKELTHINDSGRNSFDKIKRLRFLPTLITNPEEVAYITNLRDFSVNYTSSVMGKVLVTGEENIAKLFTNNYVPKIDDCFEVLPLQDFDKYMKYIGGEIYVDKSSINAHDYNLIKDKAIDLTISTIKQLKAVKTDEEINQYKDAFERTDKALRATREYIKQNDNLSEYDISQKLEREFFKSGAVSLSFKSIVAIDENSALAHYSKSSKDKFLKDGSIVLIDCGAYYPSGLATDITRVFLKGTPTDLHKKVYTTVLKAFLNAYNSEFKDYPSGYDIDAKTRMIFSQNPVESFEFSHGLGHGIGISVHESPPNLSSAEIAQKPIRENMCFTIEPGLYQENLFGIRLENSCYSNGKKPVSFTKMCYEKDLIDYNLLSNQEIEWLNEFEVI